MRRKSAPRSSRTSRQTLSGNVDNKTVMIEFHTTRYAVLESRPGVTLQVVRKGPVDCEARVNYKTRDGTARETTDFVAVDDQFGESGTPAQLMAKYGLDAKTIVSKTRALVGR